MQINETEKLVSVLLKDGKSFVSSECKRLLSNGENYGSVMLDLKLRLKDKNGTEETVHCVAKTCPPTGMLWTLFNVPATVKKEIAFYQIVVPTLNDFGKESGIENALPFFAKYYGGRISLNPNSDEVDMDAVLLLENLKCRNFRLGDRFIGFNVEETKLILRDLAVLHAVPLAHKIQKPGEFKKLVLPYLKQDLKFQLPSDVVVNVISFLTGYVSSNSKLASVIPKIEHNFRRYCEEIVAKSPKIREPFGTLVHNDLWVNNVMLRYEQDIPMEITMVDFQGVDYNSPAQDLLFFLYTSVELSLVKNSFDDLVRYYFEIFVETLRKFNCQTEQFTFEMFTEEMAVVANKYQLFHVIMMLQVIYMKKENAQELSKIAEQLGQTSEESFHENFYQKAIFVLSDYEKRGWL